MPLLYKIFNSTLIIEVGFFMFTAYMCKHVHVQVAQRLNDIAREKAEQEEEAEQRSHDQLWGGQQGGRQEHYQRPVYQASASKKTQPLPTSNDHENDVDDDGEDNGDEVECEEDDDAKTSSKKVPSKSDFF